MGCGSVVMRQACAISWRIFWRRSLSGGTNWASFFSRNVMAGLMCWVSVWEMTLDRISRISSIGIRRVDSLRAMSMESYCVGSVDV